METHYGVIVPRRMLIAFSRLVKDAADLSGGEMTAQQVWAVFSEAYLRDHDELKYKGYELTRDHGEDVIRLSLQWGGRVVYYEGRGNGPLDALVHALPVPIRLRHYEERAIGSGSLANAMAVIEIEAIKGGPAVFGAGIHTSIVTASVVALVRAWAALLMRDRNKLMPVPALAEG